MRPISFARLSHPRAVVVDEDTACTGYHVAVHAADEGDAFARPHPMIDGRTGSAMDTLGLDRPNGRFDLLGCHAEIPRTDEF